MVSPLLQFLHVILVERVAGEPDEDQDDPHVDQVAAVAPRIAMGQLHGGAQQVHIVLGGDGPRALVELHDHGQRHEQAEAE
jgi:hypothetical protein